MATISKDITIVESELKTGAKGDFISILDHEKVRFSCFNQHKDLWEVLGKNMSAHVGFEVKGIFKNIIEATPIEIEFDETKITEQQVEPKPTSQTKSEPKARTEELPYAKHPLTLAVEIACAKIQIGGEMTPANILNLAEMFTIYLKKGTSTEALKAYNQIQKELMKEE